MQKSRQDEHVELGLTSQELCEELTGEAGEAGDSGAARTDGTGGGVETGVGSRPSPWINVSGDVSDDLDGDDGDDGATGDVIICESPERATVVAEAAVEAGLPYVSFQVLLLEGEMTISGDTSRPYENKFDMDPAYISVGDHNQVMGWGSVGQTWTGERGNGRWWEDRLEDRKGDRHNPRLFDLHHRLSGGTGMSDVIKVVFGECQRQEQGWGGDEAEDEMQKVERFTSPELLTEGEVTNGAGGSEGQLFSIDASDQTCFTSTQATAASAYLRKIRFIDQLKERINKIAFELPQSSESRSETFCNERVYGNVNILLVSGVVRLSADDDDEST
jgi:hypothetical protein